MAQFSLGGVNISKASGPLAFNQDGFPAQVCRWPTTNCVQTRYAFVSTPSYNPPLKPLKQISNRESVMIEYESQFMYFIHVV